MASELVENKSEASQMEDENYLSLVEAARALNPKLFSLARLELLGALAPLIPDGASYSEIKSLLGLTDGAMYSNLRELKSSGLIVEDKVKFKGKKVTYYRITAHGFEEFNRLKKWLKRFVEWD